MPTIYAVAGGKGGTGKSVSSIMLSRAFSLDGKSTVLIDADLGAANLHTLMGMDFPRKGLSHFLTNRVSSLEDIMLLTSDKNIRLISGAGEVLGMANLKSTVKTKMIRHIKNLDVDRVILDLGAGTSFNVLDLFLTAKRHVLVISPEPTALQNVYEFLKFSIDRLLRARFSQHETITKYLHRFIHPERGRAITTVSELVSKIGARNKGLADQVENVIKLFNPYVMINMAESQAEAIKYYKAVEKTAHRYLSLEIQLLGPFFKGQEIQNAIKARQSLLSIRLGINSYPLMKVKNTLSGDDTQRLSASGM